MTRRRRDRPEPWREWLWSALLGAALAGACILWLEFRGRARAVPPSPTAGPTAEARERSVGFEVNFGFRIILPGQETGR